jgi:hypothetical protein
VLPSLDDATLRAELGATAVVAEQGQLVGYRAG